MDQLPASSSAAGLFSAHDITAESVMSELNIFRSANPMPHWVDVSSVMATGGQHSKMSTTEEGDSILGKRSLESSAVSSPDYQVVSREENQSFPMTPPQTESGSGTSSVKDEQEDDSNSEDAPTRKKRNPIPEEKKDDKYWERRRKNNIAAKRSRELRRKKMDDEIKSAKDTIQENQRLKQEIDVLQTEISSLRRLLKDANMTLSLWIRARQASEPAAQLPPMLRGSNVSFVNFPVSSNI